MQVPFFKPHITGKETEYIEEAVKSGCWTYGEYSQELENEFKYMTGKKHCLATTNATTAFELVFAAYREINAESRANNVKFLPQIEFYTPSIQWPGVLNAMTRHGNINFLDIDKETWNVVLRKQEICRNSVIVPVDLHGRAFDWGQVVDCQNVGNGFVVQDCAQSLGAKYKTPDEKVIRDAKTRSTGFAADVAIFSLYATKALAGGEGGMICTDDDQYYGYLMTLSNHGLIWSSHSSEERFMRREVITPGYKARMSNIHAALALAQLEVFDELYAKRKKLWFQYHEILSESCEKHGIHLPLKPEYEEEHNYHIFGIVLDYEPYRGSMLHTEGSFTRYFRNMLNSCGVGTSVQFSAVHLHPLQFANKQYNLPVSEWYHFGSISLPLYPDMTEREVEYVCEKVIEVSSKLS